MRRAATIDDVAREAGVSRQTVSNVLNAPGIVRESTRERVRLAIDRLGYAPHASARRLRTQRSSTIGVHLDPFAGGISGVVLDRFVHALTERASDRGLRVLVYSAGSPEEEIARLRDLREGGEIDAAVITGTFSGDPRIGWLDARGLPYVSFGRPWGSETSDAPLHLWVDVDGAAGTRAATEHALVTAGATVAFLGWPAGSATGDDRERGWREALVAAGAEEGARLFAEEDVQAARQVTLRALDAGEPDAIVCASDTLAVGAHLAAVSVGLAELPIIGFDNTPVAEALGLSSVEQRPEKVAGGVLELLMGDSGRVVAPRADASDAAPSHVLVTPRLVVR
ncbi:MAG: LacI family DNA-binding transcriptional regulator [Microbacteriaceae bacterium]|nr:LacI family DNA-binding transcriptional regulator [Microbacteriaceae bacterium]HPZ33996.1 LacI family DNA-binding transcriptional regulator [Microbacteriaceae bacterium]HQC92804.1 LacI family DNA-binding transcriptional regulator [Microbacteriaceae bacterium]